MAIAPFSRLMRHANRVRLGVHLLALWKLLRHRDTPRLPKIVAFVVLAYAVSPIDLIPDFIPVLGMLDDLILVPLGIALVVRLVPRPLWQARLAEAEAHTEALPKLWWGALLVLLVWLLLLALVAWGLAAVFVSGVKA